MSKEVFSEVDNHLWLVTCKWALRAHPNKSKAWVISRYFGEFNPSRRDRWVFGDRDSGAYLVRFVWTKIVRHPLVGGTSSPDDPALTDYWDLRRRRKPLPLDKATLRLLQAQHGQCPLCGELLLHADREPQSPRGMGDVAESDPDSDQEESDRPPGTARRTGRLCAPPCSLPLPAAAGEGTSNSARLRALRDLLEPWCGEISHARF